MFAARAASELDRSGRRPTSDRRRRRRLIGWVGSVSRWVGFGWVKIVTMFISATTTYFVVRFFMPMITTEDTTRNRSVVYAYLRAVTLYIRIRVCVLVLFKPIHWRYLANVVGPSAVRPCVRLLRPLAIS